MTNEELEKILVGNIEYLNKNANRFNFTEALNSLSNATRALQMVRQAIAAENALKTKSELLRAHEDRCKGAEGRF